MEWLSLILTFLQPLWSKCHDKTSSEDPQQMLRENYDAQTGRMDPDLVNAAIPKTRRAIHKARANASKEDRKSFPKYTREEIYRIAEQGLIESMNASPERVTAIRKAADLLVDED